MAAYLVDAETGEIHPKLSDGQREYDLEVAELNIAGDLMDLEAHCGLPGGLDPVNWPIRWYPATGPCGRN